MNEDDRLEMQIEEWKKLRRELIAAVRNAMDEPLRRFYDEHFPAVYRFVLCRTGGDHAQTEEIVGEVFYQAFRDIERYDGEHPPNSWLRGIARHRTIDALRQSGRHSAMTPSFSSLAAEHGEAFFDLSTGEFPDKEAERRELAELVEWTLSALSPDYERLLRMRYVDDLPVKKIADALSLTEKAAESRLFRARNEFRDAFKRSARGLVLDDSEVVQ